MDVVPSEHDPERRYVLDASRTRIAVSPRLHFKAACLYTSGRHETSFNLLRNKWQTERDHGSTAKAAGKCEWRGLFTLLHSSFHHCKLEAQISNRHLSALPSDAYSGCSQEILRNFPQPRQAKTLHLTKMLPSSKYGTLRMTVPGKKASHLVTDAEPDSSHEASRRLWLIVGLSQVGRAVKIILDYS